MSSQVDNTTSQNNLENKPQSSTEASTETSFKPTEETSTTISDETTPSSELFNVDFLSSSLKEIAAKEPKTEEEFYRASFEVFKELNESIKSFSGRSLSEKDLNEVQSMIASYPDIINSYQSHSENKQQLKDDFNIWELAIILFFSPQNDNKQTVQSLSFWLNGVDPIVSQENTFDWISLCRNILRANIEEVIEQLDSYNFENIEKEIIQQLLEPTLNQYKELQTSQDFYEWRETCQKHLGMIQEINNAELKIKENLVWIFNLLLGAPAYIIKTGSFFDQLLGAAHYSQFYASTTEIALIAEELNYLNPNDRCARVCTALLLNHVEDALEFCGKDNWMQTHLGHLLLAFGILKNEHIENNSDEDVIVDPIYYAANYYATEIAEKYNMWSEAIVYISICDTNRVVWVKKLLQSPRAKNIPLLQDALKTVDECSIVQAKSSIHRMIGELYEEKKDVYQATLEYGEAQDVEKLDKIGTNIFNAYLKTRKWEGVVSGHDELAISAIYDSVMQYNTLRNYLESKQFEEASRIVLDLLTSNKLPDEYKPIVFTDGDKIVSVKEQYYKREDLVKLLDVFERVAISHPNSFTSDVDIARLREKLSYKAYKTHA